MKNYKSIIATVAAGLACTAASHAALTTVVPGSSFVSILPGNYTQVGGTVVASLVSGPITATYPGGSDTDTLTTTVYSGDTANPLGGLTFVYTVDCTVGDVTGLTVDGFYGTVMVSNYAGTSGAAQQVNYGLNGNINFGWGLQTAPSTLIVVVDTALSVSAINAANIQDGVAINLQDLAPVPEPTTIAAGALMLLPLGIGAVRSLRKDRVS